MSNIAAIILAAGKGTRMKSDTHKVLHPIAGRPMLMHLMASVDALSPAKKVVVVGSGKEQLEAAFAESRDCPYFSVQDPQLGTGHAVQMAESALAGFDGDVLILYGDVPFVPTATMQTMVDRLNAADAPAVVVLAFEPEDPSGYGRVIVQDGRIVKMVEQKDATAAEKAVKLSNSGLMAVKAADLFALLARVTDDNAQKEYYLTDIVNIANADGRACVAVTTDPYDVAGINSRAQLAEMEGEWQARRRVQAMDDGATLIAPETVWFAFDTVIGRDVLIEPNVMFEPGVMVGNRVKIEAHLIVPANSDIADGTVLSRENIYSFQFKSVNSGSWTGNLTLTDRAIDIVRLGPTVIEGLSVTIRELEQRRHNCPPDLVDETEYDELLDALKALRQRINELIVAIEQGRESAALRTTANDLYYQKVAPWLRDRIVGSGQVANGMIDVSVPLIACYLALSQIFNQPEFLSFMGGAIGGLAGRAYKDKD